MALDITSYLLGKKGSGGGASGLKVEVVQELPTTGEANILYLVPKTTTGTNNVFEEYLYVNNNWELIGTTDIDLSNYIQKSLTAGLVKNDGTIDTNTYLTQEVPEVYYAEATYNNPFVFEGKKKGLYIFDASTTFYYKVWSNNSRAYINDTRLVYLYLKEDFNYPEGSTSTYNVGYVINTSNFSGDMNFCTLSVAGSTASRDIGTKIGSLISEQLQIFSGVKTFNSIPKQSNTTAPTLDTQFTNKKYVDDSIASAIGTALGGNY